MKVETYDCNLPHQIERPGPGEARIDPIVPGRLGLLGELNLENQTPDPCCKREESDEEVGVSGSRFQADLLVVKKETEQEVGSDRSDGSDERSEGPSSHTEIEGEIG